MECSTRYFQKYKDNKKTLKVFLSSGTMLHGLITDYDETSIVVDKCLVFVDKIVSISPKES